MTAVPTLTTPRFTLRPLQRSDGAALLPTLSDAEQCRYLSRPAFASEAELWAWLADPTWPGRTWIAEDRGIAEGRAIAGHASAVAGRFVAVPTDAADTAEIGYIIVAERQGQGIARECTKALIAHLFDEGFARLIAEVDPRNTPSVRLLETLGFRQCDLIERAEQTHIGWCDLAIYERLTSSRVEGL